MTFNAAKTLPRTLESLEKQTLRHFQHIVMDGASTDETIALAQAYRQRNPDLLINIVSEPDNGLYDAMNKALKMADGQYVVFLNAGDALHAPDTLSHVERMTHMGAPAVVYGETDIVDAQGRFIAHRRLKAPRELTWKSFRWGMLVCHQSFYVRLSVAPPYDLQYRYSADVDWCIRVMRAAEARHMPLVNAHCILTDYLQEGLTTTHHRSSLLERFRIMGKHYGYPTTLLMHVCFLFRNIFK